MDHVRDLKYKVCKSTVVTEPLALVDDATSSAHIAIWKQTTVPALPSGEREPHCHICSSHPDPAHRFSIPRVTHSQKNLSLFRFSEYFHHGMQISVGSAAIAMDLRERQIV
jgi:hypothetical protein